MKRNLVGKILGKIKIFVQDFVPIRTALKGPKLVIVVVVSHIQRIGCQPEKTTLHGGQSRSWFAEQGKKKKKKKSGSAPPPLRALLVRRKKKRKKEKKKKKKSRDASTYLGATQVGVTQVVSVHLASVQGFLRLVS